MDTRRHPGGLKGWLAKTSNESSEVYKLDRSMT